MTEPHSPCTFSKELTKFLACPRMAEVMSLTTLETSGLSSRVVVTKLLEHYFHGPEYDAVYFSHTNVYNIAKYVKKYIRTKGLPLDLTIDEHNILINYVHGKAPVNFNTKTIQSALASVGINRKTKTAIGRSTPVIVRSRIAADDYIIGMLPKTFKMLKTKGVDFKDMPYGAIGNIARFNCDFPGRKFEFERDAVVAHIKKFGFPLNLMLREHQLLIRVLHNDDLSNVSQYDFNVLQHSMLRECKGENHDELVEQFKIECDAIDAYRKSLKTTVIIPKDLPCTQTVEAIVKFNSEPPSDDFALDQNTVAAHIEEFGFPLEASFTEQKLFIHILHGENVEDFRLADFDGLRQVLMTARKSKIDDLIDGETRN